MQKDDEGDPHPGHKLCGYLCTVLNLPSSNLPSLPFLSPCHVASDSNKNAVFKSLNDVVLSPPPPHPHKTNKKVRMRRGIGMVNGSVSVVGQVHALVAHKCVKIVARVLHVEVGECGSEVEEEEARAVVLVDVYLPVGLWSGWQFPKSGSVAGSLFGHLSCDWGKRNLLLASGGENCKISFGGSKSIWTIPDCHVLGCKLHLDASDSSKKIHFDLYEIFNSLPSVSSRGALESSRVKPVDNCYASGIWDLTDDVLMNILALLDPLDLVRVAAACHHLRSLAALIMPCMKLKLFPHQQAAVEWMMQREQNAQVLPNPLYMNFSTEDGFLFSVNTVSGEIVTGIAPTVRDFRGGMFCDEPGLGKTITALSLILKTQGKMADPPNGVQTVWCTRNGDQRCGYYELSGDDFASINSSLGKRVVNQSARRGQISLDNFTPMNDLSYPSPKKVRLTDPIGRTLGFNSYCLDMGMESKSSSCLDAVARVVRCTRSLTRIKKNLFHEYEEEFTLGNKRKVGGNSKKGKNGSKSPVSVSWEQRLDISCGNTDADYSVCNDTWVQCDACRKWRKLIEPVADTTAAWFCSMNTDPRHQTCRDPEEAWGSYESITYFPGFYSKGTHEGKEQNVSFFISVLREHYPSMNSKTKKALNWLAKLSPDRLSQMETIGLAGPALGSCSVSGGLEDHGFHKVFQAFGFIRRVEKGVSRWYYPRSLENLAFDLAAFRIALGERLDSVRLYLSRATLIVVPANLVDHWKTQIQKHVKPGQLRLCTWTDYKKPSAHSLAWDYDVVITTFNRLSAEWGHKKKSPLMQVHWLRVVLDEGHTLGSSLNLTNKLQMAISLTSSNRWLLTGTPTPNTPDGQLSQLQPMLRFLHEETYGQSQKSWETAILRPFEAELEEGRSRLLQLLNRCLISARKVDLKTIPPCIKKVTFLNFTEEHARSYNELVVTVRRNILMADWNDPSHVESLLNPKQWKFRSATIKNVRLSCCVAGHIKVSDAGEDIQETMDVLVENGLDPISEQYALIKYYLQYGGNCLRCKEWCRLPVVTPCRHLLCLDCVALDGERCTFPGCGNLYEMETPDTLTRPENPNPKWPVPKDLIELQPSYKQDDWDPDWQSTSSSKVSYVVQRLKELQEANRENGYSMHKDSDSLNIEEQCCPSQMSNLSALLQLHCSGHTSECHRRAPEKVIIFSQFLEHIHVIEQQLTLAGVKFAGLYSPMHSSNKIKSLAMFQHDATCMALVMDGSAALGLDLSFVAHVFLMEPIWDRSIEEQVISRAHRMGATRPVHVETLAMRGTIEEQMLEFLQDADVRRRLFKGEFGKLDHELARPHRSLHDFAESNYLAQLSFVHKSSK